VQIGNFLGIYLAKGRAAVACVTIDGTSSAVAGCFNITLDAGESEDFDALARHIAAGCAERQLKFSEVCRLA